MQGVVCGECIGKTMQSHLWERSDSWCDLICHKYPGGNTICATEPHLWGTKSVHKLKTPPHWTYWFLSGYNDDFSNPNTKGNTTLNKSQSVREEYKHAYATNLWKTPQLYRNQRIKTHSSAHVNVVDMLTGYHHTDTDPAEAVVSVPI